MSNDRLTETDMIFYYKKFLEGFVKQGFYCYIFTANKAVFNIVLIAGQEKGFIKC